MKFYSKRVFLVVIWCLCLSCTYNPTTPPISKKINLYQKDVINEIYFTSDENWTYVLTILFPFDDKTSLTRDYVLSIIGKSVYRNGIKYRDGGIPIPLELELYNHEQNKIIYKTVLNPTLTSWGAKNFGINLGHCPLSKGTYTLRIKNLSDAKEYQRITSLLNVSKLNKFKFSSNSTNHKRESSCIQLQ